MLPPDWGKRLSADLPLLSPAISNITSHRFAPAHIYQQPYSFLHRFPDTPQPEESHPPYLNYGDAMAVCTFFQRGYCKFGDRCNNEHPNGQTRAPAGNYGGSNTNRFGAFNGGGDRYRPGQQAGSTFAGGRDTRTPRFHLTKDDIKADLTDQRPIYPLSCFGPGRDAPRQLIEGRVEVSPEELRVRYYSQGATGNEAVAQNEEQELHTMMQQQVEAILKDLNGAMKYVEDGADIHPNRVDIAQGKAFPNTPADAPSNQPNSDPFPKASSNSFGNTNQSSASAFGQPSTSAFGQPRPTPFGQPSGLGQTASPFGQPSNPGQTTSAFGQPANPGQSTSAFGQPSNPGQTTSAFGQTTILGGGGAFGKPTMPGSNSNPFGQPAQLGGSAFGQPSAVGSAFGKPSLPGTGSAFGQTGAMGQQSAFGQPPASTAAPAFGQPSAPVATPAFGQSSTPSQTSAFGQPSAPGSNPFGKPAFGQSGLGQPSQPGAAVPPFAQRATQPQASVVSASVNSNPFGTPAPLQQTNTFGQTGFGVARNQMPSSQSVQPSVPQPAAATTGSPFAASAQTSTPSMQPTQPTASPAAAHGNGGKPIDERDRFKEGNSADYEGEQGRILEEIYRRVGRLGRFDENEDIPLIPPKCEWIVPVELPR
ncbi:hypothetical protein BDV95DRAFT_578023 [Massariosphaeria phaeospora]|uniref:C3H1-type domain-containing protein n=1 Tax=Massariosphaeria phaeospora TaxID=100035 RepID=A0A7C8I5X3_9PLEO|nr:hypothetical protein BDV95DRAFT_578023 [Massariosphaeria phaeospora]